MDCTPADEQAAVHVNCRRGLVKSFDLTNQPSAIVSHIAKDMNATSLNFLNAAIDLNGANDAPFFYLENGELTPNATGSQNVVEAFKLLKKALNDNPVLIAVQVSGTPEAYAHVLEPKYELVCEARGNFYPLPVSGAPMAVTQRAVADWMRIINPLYPHLVWSGTQEPSHTLGFPTQFDDNGCRSPPAADMDAAVRHNIDRFIDYWAPIAKNLRNNGMLSGGVQLNAGDSRHCSHAASRIISAQMPLDYFTIQDYRPSADVVQSAYAAYKLLRANPNYASVKIMIDRYGIETGNIFGTAAGAVGFLRDEALLMPYADMLYGYNVETRGIENTAGATVLPQVIRWLQAAPQPLRPLTSSNTDMQAFALVQKNGSPRACIALWNASTNGTHHTTSITLTDFDQPQLTTGNLRILKGSGGGDRRT